MPWKEAAYQYSGLEAAYRGLEAPTSIVAWKQPIVAWKQPKPSLGYARKQSVWPSGAVRQAAHHVEKKLL